MFPGYNPNMLMNPCANCPYMNQWKGQTMPYMMNPYMGMGQNMYQMPQSMPMGPMYQMPQNMPMGQMYQQPQNMPSDLSEGEDGVKRDEEDEDLYRRPPFGPPFYGPRPPFGPPFFGPGPFFPGPFYPPVPPVPFYGPRPGFFGAPFLTGLALGGLLF